METGFGSASLRPRLPHRVPPVTSRAALRHPSIRAPLQGRPCSPAAHQLPQNFTLSLHGTQKVTATTCYSHLSDKLTGFRCYQPNSISNFPHKSIKTKYNTQYFRSKMLLTVQYRLKYIVYKVYSEKLSFLSSFDFAYYF